MSDTVWFGHIIIFVRIPRAVARNGIHVRATTAVVLDVCCVSVKQRYCWRYFYFFFRYGKAAQGKPLSWHLPLTIHTMCETTEKSWTSFSDNMWSMGRYEQFCSRPILHCTPHCRPLRSLYKAIQWWSLELKRPVRAVARTILNYCLVLWYTIIESMKQWHPWEIW